MTLEEKKSVPLPAPPRKHAISSYPFDELHRLFVDTRLLILENGWNAFEAREPGCLRALCQAAEYAFFEDLKQPLSKDLLKTLHMKVTTGVKKLNSSNAPGQFRQHSSGFRMQDELTVEGFAERIKIIHQQAEAKYDSHENLYRLYQHYSKRVTLPDLNLKEKQSLNRILRSIGKEATEEWVKEHLWALKNSIGGYVGSGFRMTGAVNVLMMINTYYILDTSYMHRYRRWKLEGHYPYSEHSDQDFHRIAKNILEVHAGSTIDYIAPSAIMVESELDRAIETFQKAIDKTEHKEDRLRAITDVVWEIENIHPFGDANLRVAALVLNRLLNYYGFPLATLYDPNRMDSYSKSEWFAEVKSGMEMTLVVSAFSKAHSPRKEQRSFRVWAIRLYLLGQFTDLADAQSIALTCLNIIQTLPWDPPGKREDLLKLAKMIETESQANHPDWNALVETIIQTSTTAISATSSSAVLFKVRYPLRQAFYEFVVQELPRLMQRFQPPQPSNVRLA